MIKKICRVGGCALGGGMIGFFANQLDTVWVIVLFALGVAMLVGSIVEITKQDKGE